MVLILLSSGQLGVCALRRSRLSVYSGFDSCVIASTSEQVSMAKCCADCCASESTEAVSSQRTKRFFVSVSSKTPSVISVCRVVNYFHNVSCQTTSRITGCSLDTVCQSTCELSVTPAEATPAEALVRYCQLTVERLFWVFFNWSAEPKDDQAAIWSSFSKLKLSY